MRHTGGLTYWSTSGKSIRSGNQSERSENILELVMGLFEPYLDVNAAADWLDVQYSTANRLVDSLEDDDVLVELTGQDRNRFYRAGEVFDKINRPIEQLSRSD